MKKLVSQKVCGSLVVSVVAAYIAVLATLAAGFYLEFASQRDLPITTMVIVAAAVTFVVSLILSLRRPWDMTSDMVYTVTTDDGEKVLVDSDGRVVNVQDLYNLS